jgi:hypothetical protein
VASVLGSVGCLASLLLLAMALDSNRSVGGTAGRALGGCCGRIKSFEVSSAAQAGLGL